MSRKFVTLKNQLADQDEWLIPRSYIHGHMHVDSRANLERAGLQVLGTKDAFYRIQPRSDWYAQWQPGGLHESVSFQDETGHTRLDVIKKGYPGELTLTFPHVSQRHHAHYYSSYERNTLSESAYMALIGFWIVAGLLWAGFFANISVSWGGGLWIWLAFAAAIGGVFVARIGTDWPMRALGYAIVSGATGLIVGPIIAGWGSSATSLWSTVVLVVVLTIIGYFSPDSVLSWGRVLFIGLITLLGAMIAGPFIGLSPNSFDFIAVPLFSLYIIYDWKRALSWERTASNAVVAAMLLFISILNLAVHMQDD